jgi:uncharacterized protein VirK/YbjX
MRMLSVEDREVDPNLTRTKATKRIQINLQINHLILKMKNPLTLVLKDWNVHNVAETTLSRLGQETRSVLFVVINGCDYAKDHHFWTPREWNK